MKKIMSIIFCIFLLFMQDVVAAMTSGIIPRSSQPNLPAQTIDTANKITRNPFQLSAQPQSIIAANSFTPLTHYSIHSLQMVGTIIIDQQHWAILTTANGITSAVTVGSQVGQEHAQVININNTSMTLRINQLRNGMTQTNTLSLALPEKT